MNNQDASYDGESRGVAMNIFAVLGFIAILLAGLWATVQLVKQISNLSFNFSKPDITMPIFGSSDKLALTTNNDMLLSGESVKIVWALGKDAQEAEGGTLTFSYVCKPGAYIKVAEANAANYRAIPCNAPHRLALTDTELSLIPVLTDKDTAEIAYAITYTPRDGEAQSKSSVLAITKDSALAIKPSPVTPEKPQQTDESIKVSQPILSAITTTTKAGTNTARTITTAPIQMTKMPQKRTVRITAPLRRSNPNGLPDLTVKIVAIDPADAAGKVTARIEVANLGTKLVSAWQLTAALPTAPAFTYVSQPQQTLYAGERAELLMTFDKAIAGTMILTVDAANKIAESLETNNSIAQTVVGR